MCIDHNNVGALLVSGKHLDYAQYAVKCEMNQKLKFCRNTAYDIQYHLNTFTLIIKW